MNIRCPQCDASLEVGTEHIFTKCPFCGVRLYYSKDGFLSRERVKPTHDSSVAINLLKSLVGKYLKVRMEYFPFYRIVSKGRTYFVPGRKVDLYGINDYIPQGDRVTLDFEVKDPEFSIEEALGDLGIEEANSIGIIYIPFFKSEDGDRLYYVDGVTGNILSNNILDRKKVPTNQHPLAILSWLIVSVFVILFPVNLTFKMIISLAITTGFYLLECRRESA